MPISPIHHVALTVADLDRSVAFYRDVLGFRKTLDMPLAGPHSEKMLRLAPGTKGRSIIMQQGKAITGEVELIAFEPRAERPTGPKRPGDPGVFLLSFEVTGEDIGAVYERIHHQGVKCYSEPQPLFLKGYGTIRAFAFEDPDGVQIELIQLPSLDEARRVHQADQEKAGQAGS
jgi:catechol 2,3-dioxygenase-like lactoylglutathione lyase family enzyme